MRENLYGFQGNEKRWYIKITVTDPRHISKLRTGLEKNIQAFNYKGLWPASEEGIMTFDSIQFVLRFMIDTGVRVIKAWHFEKNVLTGLDLWNVLG
jgi:DNA polymerase delta subunit 1